TAPTTTTAMNTFAATVSLTLATWNSVVGRAGCPGYRPSALHVNSTSAAFRVTRRGPSAPPAMAALPYVNSGRRFSRCVHDRARHASCSTIVDRKSFSVRIGPAGALRKTVVVADHGIDVHLRARVEHVAAEHCVRSRVERAGRHEHVLCLGASGIFRLQAAQ